MYISINLFSNLIDMSYQENKTKVVINEMNEENQYTYLQLCDSFEDNYGILRVKEKAVDRILKIIDDYRENNEEYNTDGLCKLLEKEGIEYEMVETEWVNF